MIHERSYQDRVLSSVPLDDIGNRPLETRPLEIDIEEGVGPGVEQFAKRPDTHAGPPQREAVLFIEPPGSIQTLQVGKIPTRYGPGTVGRTIQGGIVESNNDTVTSNADIGFDVLVAEVDSSLERLGSILRPQDTTPPMGESKRIFGA